MDRFKRFRAYARAWATGEIPEGTHDDDIVAAAIGARAALADSKILTIQELDATIDSLGISAEDDASDDEPDVGPTDRDERERVEAESRLRRVILAGGQTDTGGRWLCDAAADEIVRLRSDRDDDQAALAGAHAELFRLRGEAQMASDALEQARAKVDELRKELDASRASGQLFAQDIRKADRRGAAEMRERAAAWCDEEAKQKQRREQHLEASALWHAYQEIRALPLDGEPMATASAVLSHEDAATLRIGGWRDNGGIWYTPLGTVVADYDPRIAGDLARLREHAAELRAKAPPAAHGEPGKATGGDHAASGKDSLAEEQGAAQERRGAVGTVRLGIAVATQPDGTVHAWRLDGSSLGTSPAPCQGSAPHVGDMGQALPKPTRVEVGQRWAVDWRDVTGTIDEYVVEAATANTARLIGGGRGVRYQETSEMLSSLRWTFLGPSPQGPSPKRDDCATCDGSGEVSSMAYDDNMVGCPDCDGPVTSGEAAPAESEPTARDAVAGMLLRHNLETTADMVARASVTLAQAIERIRSRPGTMDGGASACIAALEALARGDLRAPIDCADLLAAIGRLTCERDEARESVKRLVCGQAALQRQLDEARAESAALWERIRELSALWTGLMRTSMGDRAEARDAATKAYHGGRIDVASLFVIELCRMLGADAPAEAHGPCHAPPSCETTAEMRPAEDIAREMVSDARQSDFSMESRATLFGILVVPALQGDVDDLRRQIAHLIERIRAEGLRASGRERVKAWLDNLPPEMAKVYEELKDADPKGRPLPVEAKRAVTAQAEEPSGMRIEKRDDGEYLIGAPKLCDGCDEHMDPSDSDTHCCHHLDGEHLAVGHERRDGACPIIARWPIASTPARDESSRVAIPAADDLHLFSVAPGARVDLIVPKALDPHDVMRTVAELLGLPSEEERERAVADDAAEMQRLHERDAAWQRSTAVDGPEKVHAARIDVMAQTVDGARVEGIVEGERRAKAKAAGLAERWETRGDAIRAEAATSDTIVRQVLETDASRLRLCARRLRNAFGPTDVQARLEAERAAVQAELGAGNRVLAVHEKYRAKARELVAAWRDAAAEANNKAHAANAKDDGIGVARFSATERAIEVCISDLRDAFGVDPAREG